jgi:hypothetical protein
MLMSCVFVTRDAVRHPKRFVFGKFVRKPNCSRSEAFVNRGLPVYVYVYIYIYIHMQWNFLTLSSHYLHFSKHKFHVTNSVYLFRNWVPTARYTQSPSSTVTNSLQLLTETIIIYCGIHKRAMILRIVLFNWAPTTRNTLSCIGRWIYRECDLS